MLLNKILLDSLSQQAMKSPRLRKNFNLHDSLDAPSQRLFNALQPGTQMEIHRHRHTSETTIVIQGSVKYTIYADDGKVEEAHFLKAGSNCFGFNVPAGVWHTMEPLEPNTVVFGCKDGPYRPLSETDIL
jgi:cupin fold WbuC family metalloprotein